MPARPARPLRAAVATATCCGLLLTGAALPSGAVEAPARAGAAGIGDSYFPQDGNGGYDVSHYDITDRYDVATGDLDGSTVVTARTTENLTSFNLDLVLAVDEVELGVGGAAPVRLTRGRGPGTFHKAGRHELVVEPPAATPAGTALSVRVGYHGTPGEIGFGKNKPWLRNAGETMATNEPQIAPWWFAANDHPSDKASFDIALMVPSGQQAISNGVLLGREDSGAWSTWRWRMDQPMAPYLAFFAAGRFVVEQGTKDGFPYVNAVSKQLSAGNRTRALKLMRRTPAIVAWLQSQFGDYPYDSTGGVTTALYSGFALENQSRPTYPYMGNGAYARTTVVHELAHQWFGDQVSVHRWRDIWLNEGFASWVEWRYDEAHGGRSAQRTLLNHYAAYMRSDSLWNLEIGDPGPKRLFAYPVYERGAMALQALRHRIGNHDFMRVLRTWVARHQDATGRVVQFRRLAEDVSGQHLHRFFKVWLHTGEKPARTKANGLR